MPAYGTTTSSDAANQRLKVKGDAKGKKTTAFRPNPLPYKGLDKNKSFLLTAVLTIQCLMIFNSIYNLKLRSLETFRVVMI